MKKIILTVILVLALCQTFPLCVRADDTEIYGTSVISVQPNVLIIFDTSGSMNDKIDGDPYDPAHTYDNHGYQQNAVYEVSHHSYSPLTVSVCTGTGWRKVCVDNNVNVDDILCTAAKTDLTTTGKTTRDIKSDLTCGGNSGTLYLGNWLNYSLTVGSDKVKKIDLAKIAIKNLINTTDNVRFGLMRFNPNNSTDPSSNTANDSGGKIVLGCDASKADLIDAVNDLTTGGWTPLAETLAEAGLYFAGKASWFNSSPATYISPIELKCQKNYIIFMTDGLPTHDDNHKLYDNNYINGDKLSDYDHNDNYMDDVAKYLYENDIRPDLGIAGESFERQNIITYTIGFTTDQDLLKRTATNGGGKYYTTSSSGGLSAAFEDIMASIADVNAVFVSPVVPVSRMNKTYSGNSLYVGFFKPDISGRWSGNIKKYGLNTIGDMLDKYGVAATLPNGAIKENATSFWSVSSDGPDVLLGGAGGVLVNQASRNLYTYMGTQADLTDQDNAFSNNNGLILASTLNVADAPAKEAVIDDIYGLDKDWILGDILHSQPAVIHYDTNGDGHLTDADDSFIFSGSNDGMMHCIKDSTGEEEWGFIPPDQLGRLKLLSDATATHDYFVDGTPVVYQQAEDLANSIPEMKIIFFGERRGGYDYYALDITDPFSPQLKYIIGSSKLLGHGDESLGQSWSIPTIAKIKTSATTYDNVFLMAGGYDTNQDKPTHTATTVYPDASDSMGRAVFAVKVDTGALSSLNMNHGYYADMTHCIVDVAGFDTNADGFVNRVYAGDLYGNMFAFENNNGTWSSRKLFSAPSTIAAPLKIFYAPDAVAESYGEMIFFGTGDREHPEDTSVVNRLYAIKNSWSASFTTITELTGTPSLDLVDVTDDWIQVGNATQQEAARNSLKNSKGWYLKLENPGEKVTSSVVVYAGIAYFTTYTPEAGTASSGDCEAASGRGQARLYAVDYSTGGAVYDFHVEKDVDGNVINKKVKDDRSILLGTSIPSSPVIAIFPGGTKIFIGVEGGVTAMNPDPITDFNLFYWRQITN